MNHEQMRQYLIRTKNEMDAAHSEKLAWVNACTLAAPVFYKHMLMLCDCWVDIGYRADGSILCDAPTWCEECQSMLNLFEQLTGWCM